LLRLQLILRSWALFSVPVRLREQKVGWLFVSLAVSALAMNSVAAVHEPQSIAAN